MKKTAGTIATVVFIVLTIIVTATAGSNSSLFPVAKGLLMPVLLFLLYAEVSKNKNLIAAGLFFSWLGDVLLLFENKGALFFIGGLVSFLITHIFYIIYFLKIKSLHRSLLRNQPWMAALVAAYGVSLVQFLFPYLGDMKLPVMVYAAVICTMVICSLHAFTKVNKPSCILFVAGAILFAASDSLLAINKFYKPFNNAGMMIIFTYCAAQFLIVMGVLKRQLL